MKMNKLMSLMTALLLVLSFTSTHGQVHVRTSNLTRIACIPGYIGCVGDNITITLANASQASSSTHSLGAAGSFTFLAQQNYIKINASAYFPLPTSANPTLIINSTEGIYPYTIEITYTALSYYISVSRISE
jgi:hypothetical protein